MLVVTSADWLQRATTPSSLFPSSTTRRFLNAVVRKMNICFQQCPLVAATLLLLAILSLSYGFLQNGHHQRMKSRHHLSRRRQGLQEHKTGRHDSKWIQQLATFALQRDEDAPQNSESTAGLQAQQQAIGRRVFLASTLASSSALMVGSSASSAALASTLLGEAPTEFGTFWETNPVNKRSGLTVVEAENKSGYNVAFVTYLSRFLLNFDSNCQAWWFSTKIPTGSSAQQVEKIRIEQFASFAASIDVGLLNFKGKDGAALLLQDLVQRYGTVESASASSSNSTSTEDEKRRKRARSARRQIALLFGLLEANQPTQELTKLLASVENGKVESVKLFNDTLSGFEMENPPRVVFPPPPAGDDFQQAQGRAVLAPTGKLLRIQVIDPGSGYSASPVITVSPPRSGDLPAVAEAKLTTKGPNKSSIASINLLDPGSGYSTEDLIEIEVSAPDQLGGTRAVLAPVLDFKIDGVEINQGGSGYTMEKPISVSIVEPDGTKERVIGAAKAVAEKSSFTSFDSDKQKMLKNEQDFETKYGLSSVRGVESDPSPTLPFWSDRSTSAELLRLLPSGIGLEYDSSLKRYALSIDTEFMSKFPAASQLTISSKPRNIDFGPRGRAPIEKDMQLGLDAYLRFALSGAICASGVHLALTPLDVVKTKVQTDPVKYPNIGSSFGRIFREEGVSTLFTGWLPTLAGNFVGGGVLYTVTEIIRRSLSEAAGVEAGNLEVQIILIAAGGASALGAILICPFEAVRIRTVAQPDYAANSVGVLQKMLREEGLGSLVNAIPVFLVRNIPYAMTKFTIFDISTERMYDAFPVAQEDLKLSLLVSLIGGIMGGTAAAIVSNPADTVISELKKAKSDISAIDAVNNMMERAGVSAFFVGLPLRMLFYSMIASLTFVVYDGVRFALGIGSDDLKLYLDVLSGALGNIAPPA